MGILNVTPDSFSDGGLYQNSDAATDAALQMFEDGATIVDIGGESTRPGSYAKPSAQQEADRVLPVIQAVIRARPDALLSIDTYHAATARLAVNAGAEIVNDVSGMLWDDAMAATCAYLGCGVVVMHTRGRPEDWQSQPRLEQDQVVPTVLRELSERVNAALASGISASRIVVDPGFGFGKVGDENYPLLAHLNQFTASGYPLLAGVSRKGFLGRTLAPLYRNEPVSVHQRGNATLAASIAAVLHGAAILRVHDVRPAVEVALIADTILDSL
jgi:dihydropteroate synthase